MGLGRHLRELSRLRLAVVGCVLLASFAALLISYEVRLSPLGLKERNIEIATAKAEVLVDTPLSTALDLRQGVTDFAAMTSRATLLGNLMATPSVIDYIARRSGVPAPAIRIQAPLTADFPRPVSQPGRGGGPSTLLQIPDEYRINVQVDPSVPILRIYAQAPTVEAAEELARGSIDGVEDYLNFLATRQGTEPENRVRLERLGTADGTVINSDVRVQASLVAFIVVFGLSGVAAIAVARVRRGWREAEGDYAAADSRSAQGA